MKHFIVQIVCKLKCGTNWNATEDFAKYYVTLESKMTKAFLIHHGFQAGLKWMRNCAIYFRANPLSGNH